MQSRVKLRIVAGAAALSIGLLSSVPVLATHQSRKAGNFSAEDTQTIEQIVRDYILNHPEIITKVLPKGRVAAQPPVTEPSRSAASRTVKPVNVKDHILGRADAQVKI